MKVVLFCGGLGMRIRDAGDNVPKPMVTIGYRPILWHVMKYYAHYGHRDFILCLGYRGDVIKNYFLNYSECLSNDFVFSEGGKKLELLGSDIHDWKITFVETGPTSNIGQRLKAVERHRRERAGVPRQLQRRPDQLAAAGAARSLPPPRRRRQLRECQAESELSRRRRRTRTVVSSSIEDIGRSPIRINGGFFILKQRDLQTSAARRRAGA